MKTIPSSLDKSQMGEYQHLIPNAKRVYVKLRRHGGFNHDEAIEEVGCMAQWGEIEGVKSPLGSGSKEEEDYITRSVIRRVKHQKKSEYGYHPVGCPVGKKKIMRRL